MRNRQTQFAPCESLFICRCRHFLNVNTLHTFFYSRVSGTEIITSMYRYFICVKHLMAKDEFSRRMESLRQAWHSLYFANNAGEEFHCPTDVFTLPSTKLKKEYRIHIFVAVPQLTFRVHVLQGEIINKSRKDREVQSFHFLLDLYPEAVIVRKCPEGTWPFTIFINVGWAVWFIIMCRVQFIASFFVTLGSFYNKLQIISCFKIFGK